MYQVVHHNVVLVPQATERTCWYASLLMIVRHHRRYLELREGPFYRVTSGHPDLQNSSVGADIDTPEVAKIIEGGIFDSSKMLSAARVDVIAKTGNLKSEHISLTPAEFSRILCDAGPFVYGGRVRGYRRVNRGNHAVVVTGISGPERSPILELNDPAPRGKGTRLTYAFAAFTVALAAFTDTAGKAVVVHV